MKKTIFILISIIVSSWSCFSQTDNYYFYKGEKITIDVNEKMFYVLLSDSAGLTNYFSNSSFQVTEKKSGIYFDKTNKEIKKYWKIVEVTSENVNQKEAITTWLSKNPSIERICPVIGDKYPVAVSEYFYVKIKLEDDFKVLDSIAGKMSCELVGEVANMPLWYTLRSGRSSNTLNLANYFYSTNCFQEVDPGFIFNFKNTCIDDDEFDEQWGLENGSGVDINACEAWEMTRGNPCVVVGVVDQGIDSAHNEFSSNLLSLSYDCENNAFPAQLEDNHGTHVAGIIGANQNGNQISGVAPQTSLMSISHSLFPSSTISQELASGISWAWHNGADIINCSWGDQRGDYYDELHSALLENAIDSALTHGRNGLGCVVLTAAARLYSVAII